MTLILHSHPLASYCWKVLIALRENGVPFEARLVDLGDPKAKAAFEALWPSAKIPLLEDDGIVVPETSIMIEHIELRHPGKTSLLPGNALQQLQVRLWDRIFDNYVMDPMQRFIAQQLRPEAERDAHTLASVPDDLDAAYDLIEGKMGDGEWAVGNGFTMADCAAAPSLFYAAIVRPFSPGHTRLAAYFERLTARPSVRLTIAEARPYFKYYPLNHALPARFLSDDADAA